MNMIQHVMKCNDIDIDHSRLFRRSSFGFRNTGYAGSGIINELMSLIQFA